MLLHSDVTIPKFEQTLFNVQFLNLVRIHSETDMTK